LYRSYHPRENLKVLSPQFDNQQMPTVIGDYSSIKTVQKHQQATLNGIKKWLA
jgi:hypothetical protein